jgi:hypothetical protein
VYTFPKPARFAGDKIYNPYEDCNPADWKKANFQVQSRVWFGITNGRKNTSERIYEIYRMLGYNVIGISDYMKINRYGQGKEGFVPEYEHGYNIRKTHQVCIGSEKVLSMDFPILQNLNQKQLILNRLRKKNKLVYLAHPLFGPGYSLADMRFLTNYDGVEVLNSQRVSFQHWDAALSAGHYVTILGDDDAHDLTNPDEVGRKCTIINSKTTQTEDIIAALKKGNSFGADISWTPKETYEQKKEKHESLPVLKSVKVVDDELFVETDKPATFRFIGQDGMIRKTVKDILSADYRILPDDTYVRTELTFRDGTTYYLNPVVRYTGSFPINSAEATIDKTLTFLFRTIYLILLIVIGAVVYIRHTRKK